MTPSLAQALAAPPSEAELGWNAVEFRLGLLSACGVAPAAALALAVRPEIGLGELVSLIHRGCPPDTAAAILL
jgi:hypothetical protein